jgi:hypothetical protein
VTDPFIEALSTSLRLVQGERQQKCDRYRVSAGAASFENSAFADLISGSATSISSTRLSHSLSGKPGTLASIHEICQDYDMAGTPSTSGPQCNQRRSGDVTAGRDSDLDDESGKTILPETPLVAKSINGGTPLVSPTKKAVVTPTSGTPVKKSMLPMLKRHRLSMSPKAASNTARTKTSPPMTQKKIQANASVIHDTITDNSTTVAAANVGVISPTKQGPISGRGRSPSRLPAFSKLLSTTALRAQAR